MMSSSPKPCEQNPSDLIGPGGPPKYGWAKSRKALVTGLLVLAALVGIWEFTHHFGWLWFILLAVLAGVSWFAVGIYCDYLEGQGRYDQALRLLQFLPMSGSGRCRVQADFLIAAGRYEYAERILREIMDRRAGAKVTKTTKLWTSIDLARLGNTLMETGRLEEAQRCFQDAVRMFPYHSASATGLAEALLRQGIFPQSALAHVERALNLFQRRLERTGNGSRHGAILATKAWALAACDRGAEAHEAIDAALNSPARKTKGPLAQVHYKAGMSLLALSEHRGAEEHFAQGAKLDPAGRWGRLCADALRRQSDWEAADG
jgi:tetratricopeptide (TPR) repeat protein